MLVREFTKEIQIDRQNRVVSVVEDQREYVCKAKVYDFNAISDQPNQQQDKQTKTIENRASKDLSKVSKNANHKSSPFEGKIKKKQSNLCLKVLVAILVVLITLSYLPIYTKTSLPIKAQKQPEPDQSI